MINGKIIAVFAGFAAIITIIAGGIGGVSIPDILVRTILWAVLFAGIGTGISFIIGKYLPEATQLFGGGNIPDKETQGEFEAILPEENPHLHLGKTSRMEEEEDFDESLSADEGLSAEEDISADADESSSVDEISSDEDSSDDGDSSLEDDSFGDEDSFSDSPAKNRGKETGKSGKKTPVKRRTDIDGEDDGFEEPVNEPAEIESIPDLDGISSETGIPDEDSDKIDSLPAIDSFSSFSSFDEGASGGESSTVDLKPKFTKSKTNSEIDNLIQDPLKTAKAIHTWIEKDKGG